MKIFSWVHHKFHRQNELSSTLVRDELCGDQTTILKIGSDHTHEILGQEALVDMLGGWNDGILTIGTLGFDERLSSFHFNYNEMENVRDDENETQMQLGPIGKECDETMHNNEGKKYPLVLKAIRDSFKEEILDLNEKNIVGQVLEYEILEKNNIGERTTLADLFYADYDHGAKGKVDVNPSKELPKSKHIGDAGTKAGTTKKTRIPFAKKLIPLAGENASHPIKKINKLMTKMLKRKIHPELQGKVPNSEGHMVNQKSCRIQSNERLSLLQIQGLELPETIIAGDISEKLRMKYGIDFQVFATEYDGFYYLTEIRLYLSGFGKPVNSKYKYFNHGRSQRFYLGATF